MPLILFKRFLYLSILNGGLKNCVHYCAFALMLRFLLCTGKLHFIFEFVLSVERLPKPSVVLSIIEIKFIPEINVQARQYYYF